jgi:hypothetical protein
MVVMSRCCLWLALWGLALPNSAPAETVNIKFRISAGDVARRDSAVKVPLPRLFPASSQVRIGGAADQPLPGQVVVPSPGEEESVKGWLVFIVPDLPRGESREVSAIIETEAQAEGHRFVWKSPSPGQTELLWDERPVLRYMHPTLDESTPEKRAETYKPYHHVFDPQGKILLTKGPGGLFPHHRGLFFGFNRISYGAGKSADTWHCNKGESQSHEGFEREEAGPVLGRHVCRVAWHGQDGQVFVDELRELTAWNTSRGVLLELASRLTTRVGRVKLDGDPQHAGFQFRATQQVPEKTASLTYYLRPDGRGEPGHFRNWPDNRNHVNLPWHALCFVVDAQRFTACFVDRPQNPKEARFSERDYGRFGSYFEYELTPENPLDLRYRFWLQAGEMQVSDVADLAKDFVEPVQVKLLQ